jgi:hypothetical protein
MSLQFARVDFSLRVLALAAVACCVGCATASEVMDTGGGTYMVSAHASPVRGGAAGANEVAYHAAQAFCVQQGKHAVVLGAEARDVYQGGYGGGIYGAAQTGSWGGGFAAAGNTDLHFRCSP